MDKIITDLIEFGTGNNFRLALSDNRNTMTIAISDAIEGINSKNIKNYYVDIIH